MAYEPYPACYYRNDDSCLAEDDAHAARLRAEGWSDRPPGYPPVALPPPDLPPPPPETEPEAPEEDPKPAPRARRRTA